MRILTPATLVLAACTATGGSPAASATEAPYVLVLGTAQDGGLPQIGCRGEECERARREPQHARLVTSLLIADPASGRRWLVDATPDLPEQVERMRGHPASRRVEGARPPLVDGVFLTHAHAGHYTGLLQLGPEAYGAQHVPVYGTRSMTSFLRDNGPWSLLVEGGNLDPIVLEPDQPLALTDTLRVTAIPVPHRRELSDTVAFLIEGPERSVLYLPDIDKWERWERRIEDLIARVDVALLDATFFADGEIPGRSMAEIPHPFVAESLERFAALPAAERAKIVFTHLNHTNPAADPGSAEATRVRAAGMSIARDGAVFGL